MERLVGILPQQAESHLELADVERIVAAKIAVLSLSRDLKGAAVDALAADADALRAVAGVAEVGVAARADPVRAAVVLLLLFLEAFFKHLQDFVDALFRIALRAQELAEFLHCGGRVVEPVHQLVRQQLLGEGHVLEILQKRGVKLVVIRLALDEHSAAEVIKTRQRRAVQTERQTLHERHPLVEADLEAALTQKVEKSDKHGLTASGAASP